MRRATTRRCTAPFVTGSPRSSRSRSHISPTERSQPTDGSVQLGSVVDADGPDAAAEGGGEQAAAVAGDLDVQDRGVGQASAKALPVLAAVLVDEHAEVGRGVEAVAALVER